MGTLAQWPITKQATLSQLTRNLPENYLDLFSPSRREGLSWSRVLGLY